MRILFTGATGVIGRRAIPQLIAQGHHVTAVGRTPEARRDLEAMGAEPLALDLFDGVSVALAVNGHDTVINLATHIPRSAGRMLLPFAWRENDRIRRDASAILVEAALTSGVTRVIQESFAPIYRDAGGDWIDERWPVQPVRYNRSVLDAEASARRFTAGGGTGVVLRFAWFYGADAFGETFVRSIRKGWSPLPGSPSAYFSSVTHDDAASAVVAALGVPAGIYNVADDEPLTHRDYVNALAEAVGAPPPHFLPALAGRLMGSLGGLMSRSERISNRRFKDVSGWAPTYTSAREGWPAIARALKASA